MPKQPNNSIDDRAPNPNIKNPRTPSRETRDHEYKEDGLPKTDKYSVDKKPKSDPSVSAPRETKEEKENTDPDQANYGF